MIALVAIAALMISGSVAQDENANLRPINVCKLMVDETRIRDINDCSKYYECKGGQPYEYSCGPGSQYNKDLQVCTAISQSTCGMVPDNIKDICKGFPKNTWLADPASCDGFYYCNGVNPAGQRGACFANQYFDGVLQQCVHAGDIKCEKGVSNSESADAICSVVPDGVYFGSTSGCNYWAVCEQGKYYSDKCIDDKTFFDTRDGQCGYQSPCTQSGTGVINPGNEPAPTKGSCTYNTAIPQYISDGTCSGFYYCTPLNTWTRSLCADNKAFDGKKCVDRGKVLCQNPCENTKNSQYTWVNNPDDCNKYYACRENAISSSGSCPGRNTFDVDKQRCVKKKEPGYQACRVATPPGPPEPCEADDESCVLECDGKDKDSAACKLCKNNFRATQCTTICAENKDAEGCDEFCRINPDTCPAE